MKKYEERVRRRRKGVMERLIQTMKRVRRRGIRLMDTCTDLLKTPKLDYISKLPDCMLSQILSMLSIKDELKTRVLSKRWSTLLSPRTHLNFDVSNILGTDHELQQAGYLFTDYKTKSRYLDLTICFHEFIYRVDQFLTNFQGTHIHSFLLNFPLNSKHTTIIDQWISFAIARGIERIDLLFCGDPFEYYTTLGPSYNFKYHVLGPRYNFPFALFSKSHASTLKHMHLQYCRFYNHPNFDFIPFTNLRSLRLDRVKVDEILNIGLLSNCLLLEELSLIECEFKTSMSKIVSSSLCHLQLCGSFQSNNREFIKNLSSVDCVKLTSLEYHGNLDALSINTPALKFIRHSDPDFDIHGAFSFFATLPQLEVLHLDYVWVATSIEITQTLKHLKELKFNLLFFAPMKSGLLWILTILQACPLLQKLSIMLAMPRFLENEEDMKDFETFSHDELKVIEIGGCVGNWYEMEFVTNILKCAHRLERIVMSPYWRLPDSSDWEFDPVWFQNGRDRILEKLKDEQNLYSYDCNSNPVWYQNGCEIILEKLQGRAQLILE